MYIVGQVSPNFNFAFTNVITGLKFCRCERGATMDVLMLIFSSHELESF